ncbi:MAG TPA: class I SAM-dependent methyltransferase [Opitutus sp.]|nr:class I SAM-dependent methyltransferase [Opitutus sp.]
MSAAARALRNLAERARLVSIACTARFPQGRLREILPPVTPEIADIAGDIDPFSLVRRFPSERTLDPGYARVLGQAESFSPPDAPPWSSEPTVSAFLGELAARLGARTVVELGCFVGWTSAHLALALRTTGGTLHCVDAEQRFVDAARRNLARHGLADRVSFHTGRSTDEAVLASLPSHCDLVFIDTSHQLEDTRGEIARYSARLSSGGCLALHDSVRWNGVRQPIAEVRDDFHVLTFATDHGNGLTLLFPRGPEARSHPAPPVT